MKGKEKKKKKTKKKEKRKKKKTKKKKPHITSLTAQYAFIVSALNNFIVNRQVTGSAHYALSDLSVGSRSKGIIPQYSTEKHPQQQSSLFGSVYTENPTAFALYDWINSDKSLPLST